MLWLVSSAINNDENRLQETIGTFESIWRRYPTADIWLIETSVEQQKSAIIGEIPTRVRLLPMWNDPRLIEIKNSPYALGFKKTAGEVHGLKYALTFPIREKRVFKISGRYQLTDNFNPDAHKANKATFRTRFSTGFSVDDCGTDAMLMTRLFSFDITILPTIKEVLRQIESFHWRQWEAGKVFDLEHGFWKFLPFPMLQELDIIGVRGRIGHLTHIVED